MLAIGSATMSEMLSLRRVHSRREQGGSKNTAERDAHARANQPGLDRIAHQEEAAERQRQPADPDHPLRAEQFLETTVSQWRRGRRWGRNGRLGGVKIKRRRFGRPHGLPLLSNQ